MTTPAEPRPDDSLDYLDDVPWWQLVILRASVLLISLVTRLGDVLVLLPKPRLLGPYLRLWLAELLRSPYHLRRSFETVRVLRASGQSLRELIYGETPVFTGLWLLWRAGLGPQGHLVDVGAGRGRSLLAARWLGAEAQGIELLREHVDAVSDTLRRAGISLVQGDSSAAELVDATHVYLPWTCFGPDTQARLIERFRVTCRPGTRFIAITRPLEAPGFVTLSRHRALFTWGFEPVWLQEYRPFIDA